jgi:hypothetical protein
MLRAAAVVHAMLRGGREREGGGLRRGMIGEGEEVEGGWGRALYAFIPSIETFREGGGGGLKCIAGSEMWCG